MPAAEPTELMVRRVVARPAALDQMVLPAGAAMLRVAPDDALVLGEGQLSVDDPDAIVRDEGGLVCRSLSPSDAAALLAVHADWEAPAARPALCQGLVAGVPVKLWLEDDRALLLVSSSLVAELDMRVRGTPAPPPDVPSRSRTSPHGDFVERRARLRWEAPRPSYDVVIVGGGGHGLATAYYLARRHGITNVAVLERSYIGSGNSGRNTTVIRSNYGIPEAVAFYQRSLELYQQLEEETGRVLMHRTKGLLWLAHSETSLRAERARALVNTACGAETTFVEPWEIAQLCPQLDLDGGGSYPVLGASYHAQGATARHDRVVWAYAEGAMREGVHVLQRTPVTGLRLQGGRVTGVETPSGPISAGVVLAAVGGHVSTIAAMARVRLPIVTHPLQAFVTNHYADTLDPIVISADLLVYVSQTPRGELLVGAEIDRQSGYAYRSGFPFLQSCSLRAMTLLPFMRRLRLLRQWAGVCDMSPDYSPIMGATGVDGFLVTTGWGTWGFKAIPGGGEQMAELVATGRPAPLIAPFSLDRFARDRTLADRGSAGTH